MNSGGYTTWYINVHLCGGQTIYIDCGDNEPKERDVIEPECCVPVIDYVPHGNKRQTIAWPAVVATEIVVIKHQQQKTPPDS